MIDPKTEVKSANDGTYTDDYDMTDHEIFITEFAGHIVAEASRTTYLRR